MSYFPMFVDLEKQPVLVVGGGRVALHKVQKILPFGADITVVSLSYCEELQNMQGIRRQCGILELDNLNAYLMVIAATDQPDFNHEIAEYCRSRRIPVNVVDDQEWCSFLFPSLIREGNLSIGISTGGASPAAAVYFRKKIEQMVPEGIDEILQALQKARPLVKSRIDTEKKRSVLFHRMFEKSILLERALTDEEIEELIELQEESV